MRKFVGQEELALGVRRPVSDDHFYLMTFVVFSPQFCSFCPLSFSFFSSSFLLLSFLLKTSLHVAEISSWVFVSFQKKDELCRLMN